jgi:ABC-2 type transport system permease protein
MLLSIARQSYLSYKGLFHWLNGPAYVANVFIAPGLFVMIFGLTGRFARDEAAATGFVIGMTAIAISTILMGGVLQSFANERSFGTLTFFFASSGSRLRSYLTRGVFHVPNALFTAGTALAFAIAIVRIDFGGADWIAVACCYPLMAVTTTMFALFLGNYALATRDWFVPLGASQLGFLTLSGALIPREELPLLFRAMSEVVPLAHGIDALRQAYEGAGLAAIRGDLALEALVGLGWAVLGYACFRAIEQYARRTGSYETQ